MAVVRKQPLPTDLSVGKPFGPPAVNYPRAWDYPVGFNMMIDSGRMELYAFLRNLSYAGDGLLRTVIESRKDQVLHIPYKFQKRNSNSDKDQGDKWTQLLDNAFRRPDGRRSFATWARMGLEEMFTTDAMTAYCWRTRGGQPHRIEILDGALTKVLIDDAGRVPDAPNPAYQQTIKGLPMNNFSSTEMLFTPRNPRPVMPIYGYSPTAQIYLRLTEAVRRQFYTLDFWCYSDDTEVLTKRGWLRFGDVDAQTDEFATRNQETKRFEWQRATDYYRVDYVGRMAHFTSRSLDLLVAPNHRMLVTGVPRDLGGNTWRKGEALIEAEKLVGRKRYVKIPATSIWEGVEIENRIFGSDESYQKSLATDEKIAALRTEGLTLNEIGLRVGLHKQTVLDTLNRIQEGRERGRGPSDDRPLRMTGDQFCAFMGMWLAEGSLRRNGIQIAQYPKSKGYEPFEKLLADILGRTPAYSGHQWEFASRPLRDYLAQFGHSGDKFIPREILESSPRQQGIFWHYFWLGDGNQANYQVAYTTSRRMADGLCELAQKMGMSACVGTRAAEVKQVVSGEPRQRQEWFTVSLRRSEAMNFNSRYVDYAGKISCVTVPNHTLYVRRNGKTAWCGNCEGSIPDLMISCPTTWCYSEDTEVLTKRGWLRFSEVDIATDEFATRSKVGLFEWQIATGINRTPYSGKMVHLHSDTIDQLVTPDHRCLISMGPGSSQPRKEYIKRARELLEHHGAHERIPVTSRWEGGEVVADRTFVHQETRGLPRNLSMTGDQFCAFMGAYLAEGFTSERTAYITQAIDGKGYWQYLGLLSDILGRPPGYYGDSFGVSCVPLVDYLTQFGTASEKFIPDEIMNAPARQLEIFWRFFMAGDGNARGTTLYTSSKRMADQLQAIGQRIGLSVTIDADDRRGREIHFGDRTAVTNHINYRLGITRSHVRRFECSEVEYRGEVGCVQVPNTVLYVRRNGRPCWSGNTPEQVAEFQGMFDTLLAGNLTLKSRVRFMPGDMKSMQSKGSAGELLKSEYDEWLARIICFAFSVSPAAFVRMMNRSTSENLSQEAADEGLYPTLEWWKTDVMDWMIEFFFGMPDYEFVWLPKSNVDPVKQMTTLTGYVNAGVMKRNEARDVLDLPPDPDGDTLTVAQGNSTMSLKNVLGNPSMQPKLPPGMGGPPGANGPNGAAGANGKPKPKITVKPAPANGNGNGKGQKAKKALEYQPGLMSATDAEFESDPQTDDLLRKKKLQRERISLARSWNLY